MKMGHSPALVENLHVRLMLRYLVFVFRGIELVFRDTFFCDPVN